VEVPDAIENRPFPHRRPDLGGVRMQHSQYALRIDRKWIEARLSRPFIRK
jgi:hypothetical protein